MTSASSRRDKPRLYDRLIERIFSENHTEGDRVVAFGRQDITHAARALGIDEPRNLGDVIYHYRYRGQLPQSIRDKAPLDQEWIIRGVGKGRYQFEAVVPISITPNPSMAETKVPDSTPGVIAKYALNDEQALLARLRYNRLIDIFTGVTCYSLQNHLRTTVTQMGQVETDEIYIGVDRRGVHYVFPVQAKGGSDTLSVIQIEQDLAMCKEKFPDLVCRPMAAQFMVNDVIALFDFEETVTGIKIASERHYRLVSPEDVTAADLTAYQTRPIP